MGISFTVSVMFHFDKPHTHTKKKNNNNNNKKHHYESSAESGVLKGKAIDTELGLQM